MIWQAWMLIFWLILYLAVRVSQVGKPREILGHRAVAWSVVVIAFLIWCVVEVAHS